MAKKVVMLGSIGAVLETSEIQREAYNQAMREAGLTWQWDRETYVDLLQQTGGKQRLANLAATVGTELSQEVIDRIHSRKTEIANARMVLRGVSPRPGVVELIKLAKDRGLKLAFVTTTYQANIDAVFAAVGGAFKKDDFEHITQRDKIARGKPNPDAYLAALKALGAQPNDAIAIEDTALSVLSAKRASIAVVATPGALTAKQDFSQADLVLEALASGGQLDPRLLAMIDDQ